MNLAVREGQFESPMRDKQESAIGKGKHCKLAFARVRKDASSFADAKLLPSPAEQRRDIRRGNKGRGFLTDASPIFSLHRREGTRATFDAAPGGNDATRAVALALQHFHIRKERFPPPSSPPPPRPLLDMHGVVNKTSGRQRRGNNDAPALDIPAGIA